MPSILVRHKVEDYAKWKAAFDEHGAMRMASGSKGGRLFRSATDPNELVILLEWNSFEDAQEFAQSEDLKAAMQRAGVCDKPDVYFLEELDRPAS